MRSWSAIYHGLVGDTGVTRSSEERCSLVVLEDIGINDSISPKGLKEHLLPWLLGLDMELQILEACCSDEWQTDPPLGEDLTSGSS